jgi:iron complex transport system substrate-binding protein
VSDVAATTSSVTGIPSRGVSVLRFQAIRGLEMRRRIRRLAAHCARMSGCICAFIVACDGAESPLRSTGIDDFGDTLRLERPAQRIVSLNPATTEIFFALGAGSKLIGRTHYDSYPDSAKLVPDMGPGLRPNVEAVLAARPDLVVLYASNDNRGAARRLRLAKVQTLSLKMDHISDFRRATMLIGRIIGDTARASLVIDTVMQSLERVRRATAPLPHPTVFWPLWHSPLIAVGAGSFLNEVIEIAGARNIYAADQRVSPIVGIEDVLSRKPDLIITGPDGRARMEKDPRWQQWFAKSNGIVLADTMITGRPSVRLGEAAWWLARGIHPELRQAEQSRR